MNPSLNRSLNHFLFLLFQHTRVLRYSSHFQDQSDTGDVIGWKDDNNTVGPIAVAAKQSLLRLIPHIIPTDSGETSLYRLVLDHGDFGVHNMSITMNASGLPLMTSLYDWETGCIVPGILSNPVMAVTVDLAANEKAAPSITRVSDDTTTDEITEYMAWATKYFEVRILFKPCLNKEVTAFRCAGSLQLSAQLRTCNSGRGRRTPHLVCIKSVER